MEPSKRSQKKQKSPGNTKAVGHSEMLSWDTRSHEGQHNNKQGEAERIYTWKTRGRDNRWDIMRQRVVVG